MDINKFKALLEADKARYPHNLEARFKRIFDRIAELWGTPMLENYFEDLLIDKRGAFVNQPDKEGWIPLYKAVANGHLETVKLLLSAGADCNARHASGVTAVDIALQKQRPEIIEALR